MDIYNSETFYIESATTLKTKIVRLDAIITALENQAVLAAGNSDISEYSLDDGQTKIRTVYNTVSSIAKAIKDYEMIKQIYVNRLNGRSFRMGPAENVTGYMG